LEKRNKGLFVVFFARLLKHYSAAVASPSCAFFWLFS